jgi:hypothetical protein
MMRRFDTDACKRLLERAGVSYRSGSVSFVMACNLCGKTKLYVRKKDGRSVCFHCQDEVRGWADRVLSPVVGVPVSELAEILYGVKIAQGTAFLELELADPFHDKDDYGYEDEDIVEELALPEIYWPMDAYPLVHSAAKPGLDYLLSRGVPTHIALYHDLRYIPGDRRVCFPVTMDGKMVGYQARWTGNALDENGFPVKVPKMTTKGKVGGKAVMFEKNLVGCDHAIIAEGPIDALKCHLVGGAVATMGKGVTPRQIEIVLAYLPKVVYLGLDPDAASDVTRLVKEIAGHRVEIRKLDPLPGYKDLGEMSAEEVHRAFDIAPVVQPGNIFLYFKH